MIRRTSQPAVTVQFDHLASLMPSRANDEVTTFARMLAVGARVVVTGYSATYPINAQGLALATARAAAVRQALVSAGVALARIENHVSGCVHGQVADMKSRTRCQIATIAVR